jgi:hypothetical protein
MEYIIYGTDCQVSKTGEHCFEVHSYGLHCKYCYLLLSVQDNLYDYIMVHIKE